VRSALNTEVGIVGGVDRMDASERVGDPGYCRSGVTEFCGSGARGGLGEGGGDGTITL